MLIGELAEQEDVSTATIRRLDKKGILKAERDRNGWRVFGPEAAAELRRLYRRVPSESETTQT
jgi:DNA-binding transcriptional MerR regulator